MSRKQLNLPVLKVNQSIGGFFLASIKAKDLVEISYSDVRRLALEQRDVEKYLGIQRPISSSRIKDIKKYLGSPDATFPTAIIVAIDERCAEYDEDSGILTLSEYEESDENEEEAIPYKKIIRVIDGQHRIAAFHDEDGKWDRTYDDLNFELNIAIFVGADIPEQANIFATVNLAQTKVSRSLVYDLTELAKNRSPLKTCHNVAVALDGQKDSPFHIRIKRLGTKTPGRTFETLTQASFVEALVRFISKEPMKDRNDLLDDKKIGKANPEELKQLPFRNLWIQEKDVDIAEILFNYFSAIRRRWPNAWEAKEKTGNLLPRSNAFKAFMKFLRESVYLDIVKERIGRVPTAEEFYPYFRKVKVEDKDFTTRYFAPGSGGQSTFLRLLKGEINLEQMLE